MSVLIETPMDFSSFANSAFVSTPTVSSSSSSSASAFGDSIRTSTLLNSRKRKSQDIVTDEFDFNFAPAPRKLLRREVSADDVRKLDVNWSFPMNSNAQDNVDCSFSDKNLLITTRRADHRLEHRCLPLPDHIDKNSLCLCFDSNNCLLIGFNYIPGFQVTPCIS